jgi:hypothetical protein
VLLFYGIFIPLNVIWYTKEKYLYGRVEMYKTIDGIYENGKIILKEKPLMKKAIVEVTFLHEIGDLKLFKKVPDIFLNPIKVSRIKKISREELHER